MFNKFELVIFLAIIDSPNLSHIRNHNVSITFPFYVLMIFQTLLNVELVYYYIQATWLQIRVSLVMVLLN